MDNSKLMGEGKILKLLMKFSIPAVIGLIVIAFYNAIDRIFIGQAVGSKGIAAITIGLPFLVIISGFGMLVGIGAASLISIKLGEKKNEEAEIILGNAIILLIIIFIFLTFICLKFLKQLLVIFGANNIILPIAYNYWFIILFGAIFQGISFGMSNFIRGEGNPKVSMLIMLIGSILNIFLDPIFIFLFKWGIKGAAIATILSQFVSMIVALHYYYSKKSILNIHVKNFKLNFNYIKKIFAVGSAPFLLQTSSILLLIVLNNMLLFYGGYVAISALGIVNIVIMLITTPIYGLNYGAQPIIGYNYGARKFSRVKKTLKSAIIIATIICLIGFILTQLFPKQIISIFDNNDKNLLKLGVKGIRIFLMFLPIVGFQIVGANYFQSIGKSKHAMFFMLSRQFIFLVPSIFIFSKFFGLDGILWAGPFSDLISFILTFIFLYFEIKNLNEMQKYELKKNSTEQ